MKNALANLAALRTLPGYPSLAFAVLILGIANSFTYPFMSLFGATEANMSPVALGVFMTLISVSGIMVGTFLGVLSDRRVNRKLILLLAIACAATGYAALPATDNYLLLVLIGCVFLSVGGAAFPQLFAYAKATLDGQRVASTDLGITTLRTVFSLAWVLGPAVGALVLSALGFSGLFLSAAAVFVLVGLIVWRLRTPTRPQAHTPSAPGLRTVIRDRKVAATLVSFTLLGTSSAMTMIALPLYVVNTLDGSKSDVGVLLSLAAGLEIPLMLALGALASRLNKARMLACGAALQVTYFLAVLLAGEVSHLLPAQLLTAAVVAITAGLGMAYFQDLLPHAPGSATTLFANTTRLGSILAGVLAGVTASAFGYQGVFVLGAALSAIAAVVLFVYAPNAAAQPPVAPADASVATD